MTGFDAKRQAAQAKLQGDDAQGYIAEYEEALLISYQSGFADGKRSAQPEQEPVAWAVQGITQMIRGEFAELDAKSKAKRIGGTCVAYPLYTAPPQRSWVGLTDEDMKDPKTHILDFIYGARWAEAKLKERNT